MNSLILAIAVFFTVKFLNSTNCVFLGNNWFFYLKLGISNKNCLIRASMRYFLRFIGYFLAITDSFGNNGYFYVKFLFFGVFFKSWLKWHYIFLIKNEQQRNTWHT